MKRIITFALCGFVFGVCAFYGHVSAATLGRLAAATVGAMHARVAAVQEARNVWH
jgi:hypothetical protein